MSPDKVKAYTQEVACRQCGQRYSIAHEANDEGFGYAAVLYECERTRTVFYHSQADPQYYGPPNEKIIEINLDGEYIVRRTHPVLATCPKCGAKDFDKQGKSTEEFIEAVPLYKMHTEQGRGGAGRGAPLVLLC
jgi:ssDNA-binding Zn-finger/Zn-ribbon topoisomerase 1